MNSWGRGGMPPQPVTCQPCQCEDLDLICSLCLLGQALLVDGLVRLRITDHGAHQVPIFMSTHNIKAFRFLPLLRDPLGVSWQLPDHLCHFCPSCRLGSASQRVGPCSTCRNQTRLSRTAQCSDWKARGSGSRTPEGLIMAT